MGNETTQYFRPRHGRAVMRPPSLAARYVAWPCPRYGPSTKYVSVIRTAVSSVRLVPLHGSFVGVAVVYPQSWAGRHRRVDHGHSVTEQHIMTGGRQTLGGFAEVQVPMMEVDKEEL